MRKVFILLAFCIFLSILGCSAQTYQSIEESMKKSNISYTEIINEENYGENGRIVFYRVSNPQNIGIGYLEETSSGWIWIDGGEHSLFEENNTNEKMTWFSSYQVKTKAIEPNENLIPLYMGLVIDPNIERVVVKTITDTPFSIKEYISIESQILQYRGARIWYVINPRDELMKLYPGPFNILGYSKHGDVIYDLSKL